MCIHCLDAQKSNILEHVNAHELAGRKRCGSSQVHRRLSLRAAPLTQRVPNLLKGFFYTSHFREPSHEMEGLRGVKRKLAVCAATEEAMRMPVAHREQRHHGHLDPWEAHSRRPARHCSKHARRERSGAAKNAPRRMSSKGRAVRRGGKAPTENL